MGFTVQEDKHSPEYTPNLKELNQKLNNCYRTHVTSDEDVEWNRAIYRALRIVNGEE